MGQEYFTKFISIVPHHSITLDFMPSNVMIEGSCLTSHVLLCSINNNNFKNLLYYVCKLTTREWVKLPNPKSRCTTMKMAIKQYDSFHFKIIRFSWSRHNGPYTHWEIFDSKKWAWLKYNEYKKLPLFTFVYGLEVVSKGYYFHWQIIINNKKMILAFNIDCENWKLISFPKHLEMLNSDFCIDKELVECEGDHGVMYSTKAWMELWIMEDYSNQLWEKKYRVSLEVLNREIPWKRLLALYTIDVALMYGFGKLIWYDCKKEVQIDVVEAQFETIVGVHAFQSDFTPCNVLATPSQRMMEC
ncbi:uncharacterized protein LOC122665893 [Telopea speciosissima]|uniref:uncharacterized protein LOC122665893 n=1 Tax=Telopea speciosissima TaxID=54955 RepID=UPI001CC3AEEF|nr:uncharacterized protein LOC122665893 [Telopea speciosissima]